MSQINEFIERYVYDVVRRIPAGDRKDTSDELKTIIDDMLIEECGEKSPSEDSLKSVLKKLGRPADLADKYRGSARSLISGTYYDIYIFVLKIVLLCTAGGLIIALCIQALTTTQNITTFSESAKYAGEIFHTLISGIFSAFTWVTIIFALNERTNMFQKIKEEMMHSKEWALSDLPKIPLQKSTIKRSEIVADLIVNVVFMAIVLSAPQIIGVWGLAETKTIPLFDLSKWHITAPLLAICFILGIVKAITKLVTGRYCFALLITTVIINILSLSTALFLIFSINPWNPNFNSEILTLITSHVELDVNAAKVLSLQNMTKILAVIISAASILDIAVTAYRTFRYSKG